MFKALINTIRDAFKAPPVPEAKSTITVQKTQITSEPTHHGDNNDLVLLKVFPDENKLALIPMDPLLYDPFSPDPFRTL